MTFVGDETRDGLRLREITLERPGRSVTAALWQQRNAAFSVSN